LSISIFSRRFLVARSAPRLRSTMVRTVCRPRLASSAIQRSDLPCLCSFSTAAAWASLAASERPMHRSGGGYRWLHRARFGVRQSAGRAVAARPGTSRDPLPHFWRAKTTAKRREPYINCPARSTYHVMRFDCGSHPITACKRWRDAWMRAHGA
jgi:hypothetical protein